MTIGIGQGHTNPGAHHTYRETLKRLTQLRVSLKVENPHTLCLYAPEEPPYDVQDSIQAYKQELLDLAGLDWWDGDVVVMLTDPPRVPPYPSKYYLRRRVRV